MYTPGPIPTPVLSPDDMLMPVAVGDNASLEDGPEESGAGEENGAAGGAIGSTARGRRRLLYGEGGTVFKSGGIFVFRRRKNVGQRIFYYNILRRLVNDLRMMSTGWPKSRTSPGSGGTGAVKGQFKPLANIQRNDSYQPETRERPHARVLGK